MKRIAAEVPGPLVVNMIEGGKTPLLPLEEVRQFGFISVGYVLSGLFAAPKALSDTYEHLPEHGYTFDIQHKMMTFDDFTRMISVKEKYELDEKFKSSP